VTTTIACTGCTTIDPSTYAGVIETTVTTSVLTTGTQTVATQTSAPPPPHASASTPAQPEKAK
jgi:hypothetical protein